MELPRAILRPTSQVLGADPCVRGSGLPTGIPPGSQYLLGTNDLARADPLLRNPSGYTAMGVRNWAVILGVAAILQTSADASGPAAGGRISWKKGVFLFEQVRAGR